MLRASIPYKGYDFFRREWEYLIVKDINFLEHEEIKKEKEKEIDESDKEFNLQVKIMENSKISRYKKL